jgi:chromosome segregation ATPase
MSSSSVISSQIEAFQHQGDLYTKKIEIEKRRISELDDKLKGAKSRLAEARRSMGGVNEAQNQMKKKQRSMHVLENQLEKAIVRLNEATAFNQQKRRDIEDLRREKLQRDGIEKSQMNKLKLKKVELVEIIEQSQRAMEARDLARAQIVALKKRIGHEVNKFEVEWSARMTKLEGDRKM